LLDHVAIKVLKKNQEAVFEDEFMINRHLTLHMPPNAKIIALRRAFYHGDNACLVFELAAHNILELLHFFDDPLVGIPFNLLRKIVRDTLEGLSYMHEQNVIHTDIKPENIFATRPLFPHGPFPGRPQRVFDPLDDDPGTIDFKIGDIGNSCFLGFPNNSLIQTRQYRSPEVLLGLPYDASADIWSLACMTYEFAVRSHLFDPRLDEDAASQDSENKAVIDALHLSMIEKVIGPIPEDWARLGQDYDALYQNGELVRACTEELPSLFDLLRKHGVPSDDAGKLAEFLTPMLAIIPAQRPTAQELLTSPWLLPTT
jgi:serine/threonine protein kinase